MPSASVEESIGETVVLDLKTNIEKLREENQNLKLVHSDCRRKGEELANKIRDDELHHAEAIAIKEQELNEVKRKEKLAINNQNKLKAEFSNQLANVDMEIKGLTKSLDDKRKELELCKRESAEIKMKNNKLQNESAEMVHVKSKLMDTINVLEKEVLQKECVIQENKAIIEAKKEEIENGEQRDGLYKKEIAGLKSAISNQDTELSTMRETQSKTILQKRWPNSKPGEKPLTHLQQVKIAPKKSKLSFKKLCKASFHRGENFDF